MHKVVVAMISYQYLVIRNSCLFWLNWTGMPVFTSWPRKLPTYICNCQQRLRISVQHLLHAYINRILISGQLHSW